MGHGAHDVVVSHRRPSGVQRERGRGERGGERGGGGGGGRKRERKRERERENGYYRRNSISKAPLPKKFTGFSIPKRVTPV